MGHKFQWGHPKGGAKYRWVRLKSPQCTCNSCRDGRSNGHLSHVGLLNTLQDRCRNSQPFHWLNAITATIIGGCLQKWRVLYNFCIYSCNLWLMVIDATHTAYLGKCHRDCAGRRWCSRKEVLAAAAAALRRQISTTGQRLTSDVTVLHR